jgi:hypothetical protein
MADVKHKLGGVEYPLAWGNLALFRFRSIPAAQRNVVGPAQMAQFLWAAYKGISHPFATWEHVLAAVSELSEADFAAISEDMVAKLPEPEQSPENATESPAKEPAEAEKKSTSTQPEPSPAAVST